MGKVGEGQATGGVARVAYGRRREEARAGNGGAWGGKVLVYSSRGLARDSAGQPGRGAAALFW